MGNNFANFVSIVPPLIQGILLSLSTLFFLCYFASLTIQLFNSVSIQLLQELTQFTQAFFERDAPLQTIFNYHKIK